MLLLRAQRGCRWSQTALATPGGGAVRCLCDQCPCLAGREKNGTLLHQSPYQPTCKAKANEGVFAAEEPTEEPHSTYYTLLSVTYNTLSSNTPVKQASVKRLLRFS